MDKTYSLSYLRGERAAGGVGVSRSRSTRSFRYSGAHTTALDRVPAPTMPEMSYTARKYSSASYMPTSGSRRSTSRDKEGGRTSQDRVSSERYTGGRGGSSDRLSSGYSSYSSSSRRGSSSSDHLPSTPTSSSYYPSSSYTSVGSSHAASPTSSYGRSSPSTSSTLSGAHSTTDLSGYGKRYSSERNGEVGDRASTTSSVGGRYSRHSSGDLSTSSRGSGTARYSITNSGESVSSSVSSRRSYSSTDTPPSRHNSAELTNGPGPLSSTFINGYATMERRSNRRKKDFFMDRKSAERVPEMTSSYSSLDRRKKYGRTFSCDLPSCRMEMKDYNKELSAKYGSRCLNNNNCGTTNTGSMSRLTPEASQLAGSGGECVGGGGRGEVVERERSPSVQAIHEGLARINQALEKHRNNTPEVHTATMSSSTNNTSYNSAVHGAEHSRTSIPAPPPPPPPPPSSASKPYGVSGILDTRSMRAALTGGCRSPGAKSPRSRVNNFVPVRENVDREVNLVPDIVIPAEARLAQRRAARAEARELRLRELEKQQQDQENDEEKQFTTPSYAGAESGGEDEDEEEEEEPTPRAAGSGRTSGRTAGLNSTGQFSRRSSEDSTTDESLPANVREMRAELKELDEKFRKAMITNAQLDNEKATLTFEVELMKDRYTELEETHTQLTKEHRKKCTEFEQLRKVSTKLQEEVKVLRGLLQERDQLIQEYGLVVVGEEENGEEGETGKEEDDMDDLSPRKIAVKKALISQEAAELLEKGAAKGSLDIRLKKFGEEKNDLEDQVRRLKLELEEERNKNRRKENGLDYEKQKEQSKTVNEYKFRVQKAEAEVSTLQANVARLDALSTRYRTQSEELEKSEEELKGERRKLQRELREAQSRLEELETTNNHLIKRFDKLKNARSTLLKDLSQEPA